MKRWNWPTTILYIKHKKANLKQGCSKLVGKKRKAPTGGWSGRLNCPTGMGKKTIIYRYDPLGDRGCGARHHPRGRAGKGAQLHPTPPAVRGPHARRAGNSSGKLSRRGRSPGGTTAAWLPPGGRAAPNPPSTFLPGVHLPETPPSRDRAPQGNAPPLPSCRHGSLGGS